MGSPCFIRGQISPHPPAPCRSAVSTRTQRAREGESHAATRKSFCLSRDNDARASTVLRSGGRPKWLPRHNHGRQRTQTLFAAFAQPYDDVCKRHHPKRPPMLAMEDNIRPPFSPDESARHRQSALPHRADSNQRAAIRARPQTSCCAAQAARVSRSRSPIAASPLARSTCRTRP